jgi:hypothetical protein
MLEESYYDERIVAKVDCDHVTVRVNLSSHGRSEGGL